MIDKRTPEKKERKRDALFAPVVLLQDDLFSPTALSAFVADLSSEIGSSKAAVIEVEEFKIADYFPVRLGAGAQGFLGPLLFQTLIDRNTDWKFVEEMKLDPTKDSVLCIFVGRVNGQEVKASANAPYKVSLFAGLIYNDPDFQRAVQAAVKETAGRAALAAGK